MRWLVLLFASFLVPHGLSAQIAVFTSEDAEDGDRFGTSMALNQNGTVLVVGANNDGEAGDDAGAAYLFERSGTSWVQTWKFLPPPGFSEPRFGSRTDISADGDRVLIASESSWPNGPGGAFVYAREAGGWVLEVPFTDIVPAGNINVGVLTALSADGAYALVSAYGDEQSVVHVFRRTGSTWALDETFDVAAQDVALSADGAYALLSIGTWFPPPEPVAYLFHREGSAWTQEASLFAPEDMDIEGSLGYSAALSGDGTTALLGAPQLLLRTPDNQPGPYYTGGFLYQREGDAWVFRTHLENPPGYHVGDNDGEDVALNFDGTRAMVGSPANYYFPSTMQVFEQAGGEWIQIHGSTFEGNSYYGGAVALSSDGQWGAVSAPRYGYAGGPPPDPYPGYVRVLGPEDIPVELTSFDAVLDGSVITLTWETASETNNAGFEVQIRHPGQAGFDALGFVDGHGTSTEAHAYAFTTASLAPGTYTFRLKQVDFDGSVEHHGTVEVSVGLPGSHVLSGAYPNPFNPSTRFTLTVARSQRVEIGLYNVLGQRVAVLLDGAVEAGVARDVRIDGRQLASGTYVVRVAGDAFHDTFRVTLAK